MRHPTVLLTLLLLILAGCGRSDPRLAEREVGPLIYQPGDLLPAEVLPGDVENAIWPPLEGFLSPHPTKASYQEFYRDGKRVGVVQIGLYESRKDMGSAMLSLGEDKVDEAFAQELRGDGDLTGVESRWSRCFAMVLIHFTEPFLAPASIDAYSDAIQQRIEPVVCAGYDVTEAVER